MRERFKRDERPHPYAIWVASSREEMGTYLDFVSRIKLRIRSVGGHNPTKIPQSCFTAKNTIRDKGMAIIPSQKQS